MTCHSPSRTGLLALTLSLLVSAIWPGTARAQQPSPEELEQFRESMTTGVEHYRRENYEAALESFRRAERIASPPSLRYNIGRVLQALHRCEEAETAFETYLEHEELEPEDERKAKRHLDELEDCTPRGTLEISCRPTQVEATVTVDGTRKSCPATFELPKGSHSYRVEATGYEAAGDSIHVYAEETVSRTVRLTEAGSRPARPPQSSRDGPGSWQRIGQIGGMLLGAGLISGGVLTDLQADDRVAALQGARRDRDIERIRALEREAGAARTRGLILYGTGAAALLTGATWLTLDLASAGSSGARARFHLSVRGNGLAGGIRW